MFSETLKIVIQKCKKQTNKKKPQSKKGQKRDFFIFHSLFPCLIPSGNSLQKPSAQWNAGWNVQTGRWHHLLPAR